MGFSKVLNSASVVLPFLNSHKNPIKKVDFFLKWPNPRFTFRRMHSTTGHKSLDFLDDLIVVCMSLNAIN